MSGHCYQWLPTSGDWFESRHQCSLWAPSGELVSVETEQEWDYLRMSVIPSETDAWIGLSRGHYDDCPGNWAWESGEDVVFTDWDSGEPDEGSCPACTAAWNAVDHRWDDLACDASGLVS